MDFNLRRIGGVIMLYFILFFAVILPTIMMIIMGILAVIVKFQKKNLLKQILTDYNITNYTSSNQFADNSYLMVDHARNNLWVITDESTVRAKYRDIREVKFVIDDTVAYKTSLASATGRAVVGGVLFGGLGAVVGGATAKKLGKKKVHRVALTISFINCDIPYLRLMLLDNTEGVSIDDYRYENAEKDGLYWSEYITSIID